MKAYVNFITSIALGVILFGSCSTKKQTTLKPSSSVVLQVESRVDKDSSNKAQYIQSILRLSEKYTQKDDGKKSQKEHFELAFQEMKDMLEGKAEASFERAVFISENPYNNGIFKYKDFQGGITQKLLFIKYIIQANDHSDTIEFDRKVNKYGRFNLADLEYLPEERKELYRQALCNWAIFEYLTDTISLKMRIDSTITTFYHTPYRYATADPFGMRNWRNSQVTNLLISEENTGNCFALTALFKILSDRLSANARICTAPQHIYIQHKDFKGHYYNVELATAGHPGDGIIQTLTYTPTEGIISGIALRDYTTKQSIGLCIVNLAKSYERKFNTKDDEFLLRCAELALAHDSLNLNALLLKQQVLDSRVTKYAVKNGINSVQKLKQDTGIAKTALKLEKHLALLYNLGYREMPLDMQELITNPFGYDPSKWNRKSQNARPFASFEPKDPKDAEYWTLTKGMFKEIWEPTEKETYGHYTITTATGKLKAMDTASHKGILIDPVAFAYDFGARMYDARIGHFVSIDPQAAKYPSMSPYAAFGNNPILLIDPDGETIKVSAAHPETITKFQTAVKTAFSGKVEAKITEDGTVTFHQLPDTKLTETEQSALNILNQSAGSADVATLKLVDNNNGGNKVPLDNFTTSEFDVDDMMAFGNDDNLLTSKSVLVHTVVEQLTADNQRKHGVTDEYQIYDVAHQKAIESEMQTTNLMRSTQADVIIQDSNGGSTSINNSLLREDGKYKEVKYIMKFQDGNLESQKTEPVKK